jgi:hypothetical protein
VNKGVTICFVEKQTIAKGAKLTGLSKKNYPLKTKKYH